jgi:hypothetical protein
MTPEKLEMHQRLQPLYKKMMGEWQGYDKAIQDGIEGRIIVMFDYNNQPSTFVFWSDYEIEPIPLKDDTLRIPLPIDPVNPERGLWGMVDWEKYYLNTMKAGSVIIRQKPKNEHDFDSLNCRIIGDPEEALLKALLEQEGL